MFARIKPLSVVSIRNAPVVWGTGEFIKAWKYLTLEQKKDYSDKFYGMILEVEKLYKNRKCTLIAEGYGSSHNWGAGPIKVNPSDLLILRNEEML